jgi:hypothetical protein
VFSFSLIKFLFISSLAIHVLIATIVSVYILSHAFSPYLSVVSDIVICTMVHDCTLYTYFERLTVLIYHVRVLIDDPLLPTVVLEG